MAKFKDFETVYGKLGNHPGLLQTDQAIALYNTALSCGQKPVIVEHDPDGGRSTVVLAAAACNLEGKVHVQVDWSSQPDGAEAWFNKAVKLHRIGPQVAVNGAAPERADLLVVRHASQVNGTAAKRIFLLAAGEDMGDEWGLQEGTRTYSIWGPKDNV